MGVMVQETKRQKMRMLLRSDYTGCKAGERRLLFLCMAFLRNTSSCLIGTVILQNCALC